MLKADARKYYRDKRMALTNAERSKLDDLLLIQFQTMKLPFIQTMLSYWPIEENKEPNTHLFTDFIILKFSSLSVADVFFIKSYMLLSFSTIVKSLTPLDASS